MGKGNFKITEYNRLKNNPPKGVRRGTKLICKNVFKAKLTIGNIYTVISYHQYLKKDYIGLDDYVWRWYEFINIHNNTGYIVKVNLNNFEVIDTSQDLPEQYKSWKEFHTIAQMYGQEVIAVPVLKKIELFATTQPQETLPDVIYFEMNYIKNRMILETQTKK